MRTGAKLEAFVDRLVTACDIRVGGISTIVEELYESAYREGYADAWQDGHQQGLEECDSIEREDE